MGKKPGKCLKNKNECNVMELPNTMLVGKVQHQVESKPLKTTYYTMESDILKKKKKKGDILYVFESFIMSIVFVTKISSWLNCSPNLDTIYVTGHIFDTFFVLKPFFEL